jgi:predicted Zn finger-like uncharacterized protein
MIVTCPSCSARYKIKDSKLEGRGARITCPRCAHRFVVYRDDGSAGSSVPGNVDALDFNTVGVTWRVRKGIGVTYEFHDLATLRGFLDEGQVDRWDRLSYDNRTWTPIDTISDLSAHFHDIWEKAKRGEIQVQEEEDDEDDEDESDAPTTIVGRGSSLASEIRQAVTAEATPPPISERFRVPVVKRPPVQQREEAIEMAGDDDESPVPSGGLRQEGIRENTPLSVPQAYQPAPLDPSTFASVDPVPERAAVPDSPPASKPKKPGNPLRNRPVSLASSPDVYTVRPVRILVLAAIGVLASVALIVGVFILLDLV